MSAHPAIRAEDGRTVRAERTRAKVVDALLELLDGGEVKPTAERIAGRAGVSERTIFQHFADREVLFEAVALRQWERIMPTLSQIPLDLPVEHRIDRFVEQRTRLLETVSGVRRGALMLEPESEVVAEGLARARRLKGAEVDRVFGREIAARPPHERRALRAALVSASAWTAWEGLRAHQGLGARQAREVVRLTLERLLAG